MGNMDQSDSWTTVSTTTFSAPLHSPNQVRQVAPVYLPAGAPKDSDTSSDSGKHRFTGLELESSPSDHSWMDRIRWFRNTRSHRDAAVSSPTSEIHYVGGTMESAVPSTVPTSTIQSNGAGEENPKLAPISTFNRIASWMTQNSSQHDEESVLDFQESEWTPPDSSYGAACPLFGWIPKNIRQNIEYTIILLLVLGLVYLVVMLSIIFSEARRDESLTEESAVLDLDDDRYIGYTDDKSNVQTDDDPYWSSSNNGYGGQRERYF